MDNLIYSILLISIILISGKDQRKVFALFLLMYLGKVFLSEWISGLDIKETRFYLNNSLRVIQHLALTILISKYIYTDHRAIIPTVINTMIVVFYSISNIAIFYDNWQVQYIIFDYKLLFGGLVLLSFFDYGDKVYNGIFRNFINVDDKCISSFNSGANYENNMQKEKS